LAAKFEYKCLLFESTGVLGGQLNLADLEKTLNEYGAEGWEVVSIIDTEHAKGRSRETVVTMKRQK